MNRQEMFNQVATHLLTQKKKAGRVDAYSDFMCLYRDENGCKCAIGALIPDDKYDPRMEGSGVQTNYELAGDFSWASIFREIIENENDKFFASCLQSIHDNKEVETWKKELQRFARNHDLDASVLEKFA